jgi:glutamate racemase
MRILIFDSGIGGLGTAAELRPLLPQADLIYLADNAGFPYGEQPDATLTAAILHLMSVALDTLRPDLVVVACNTASTIALDALRARFTVPFVGCVPPVKWAAAVSQTRVIGLLATPATIRRPYLQDLTTRYAADCIVLSHGAPHLARIAEARFAGLPVDLSLLESDLAGLARQPQSDRIDAIAIGCTHYPRLLPEFRAAFSPAVTWLDPAPRVAQQACRIALGLAGTARPSLDGTAVFTGSIPTGGEASGWSAAGFPRHGRL